MTSYSLEYRIYKIHSGNLLGKRTEQEKNKSVRNKPHGRERTPFRFAILPNIPAFQQKIMRHSQQNKKQSKPEKLRITYKTVDGLTMCKDVKREKKENDIGAMSIYYVIKLALI